MKTATIGRIAVLIVLFSIGFLALFAEPEDNAENWFLLMIGSKAIAAASIYAGAKLYNQWKQTDEWLAAYDKMCDEATDAPNPMYYDEDED